MAKMFGGWWRVRRRLHRLAPREETRAGRGGDGRPAFPMPAGSRPTGSTSTSRLLQWLRTPTVPGRRVATLTEQLGHRASPNHWTFLFGAISFACLTVLIVTGVVLMLFYEPSSTVVEYQGSYPLLRGVEMSKALESTLHISFDVKGGLLVRQAHHWAALVLPASLIVQMLSLFFTGAFRKPRRWSWVLLFGIFVLVLVAGWSGYALPDDMLSGTGLRIVQGVVLGIPIVGTWLSFVLFGGEFPGEIIPRIYAIHLIASAVLVVLVAVRHRLASRQRPPQFPGPGRNEGNVVGISVWPGAAVRSAGLFVITTGVLMLMGGTLTISPVWSYGPASTGAAFAGSQPDWYMAFLDGALRLVPDGWEVVWLGRTWSLAIIVPLALTGLLFFLIATYPFIEGWISGDPRDHHILDRPRNTPTRTGLGVAGVVFYVTLWTAGSADVIATIFDVSFEGVIWFLRGVAVFGPALAYIAARQVCFALQARETELLLHGAETGRIVRDPGGGYTEPHRPLDARRRWQLANVGQYPPPLSRPDDNGKITKRHRVRARLHRSFFENGVQPSLRSLSRGAAPSTTPADQTSRGPGVPVASRMPAAGSVIVESEHATQSQRDDGIV